MSHSIKPVKFKNKRGFMLFGMLHKPEYPNKKYGIILLSPGIKSRVAPHRLYVKMAEFFCEKGFYVLRFDPEGLGDSEGEIQEKYTADVYGSIQVGRYIDDTISAIDWMENELNIKKFILSGLCGGAITGLLAGAKEKRVDSLIALGIPVILDNSNVSKEKYITSGELKYLGKEYLRKFFDFKSWLRFFTFKSDYFIIVKFLFEPFKKNKKKYGKASLLNAKNNILGKKNFNNMFLFALENMVTKSRKVCLIFGENDRLYWEFNQKFNYLYKDSIVKYRSMYEVYIVEEARHIFEQKTQQERLFGKIDLWLQKNLQNDSRIQQHTELKSL